MHILQKLKRFLFRRQKDKRGVLLINVKYDKFTYFAHHSEIKNSTIGSRTSIGRYTKVQFADIGKYCSISWDVTIGAIGHPLKSISTHAFPYRRQFGLCESDIYLKHERCRIGNDVWIGCHVVIMPGVTVGSGAVIGAGAIVTHDVKPYEIVAGCPAKHIKYRFEEEIIDELLKIEWWNFPDKIIQDNILLFSPNNDLSENKNILK